MNDKPQIPRAPWAVAPDWAFWAVVDSLCWDWVFSAEEPYIDDSGEWALKGDYAYLKEWRPMDKPIPLGVDWRLTKQQRPI